MKCKTCPICGSNIDFGERCDCERNSHDQPEMETARRSSRPRRRKPAYNSPEYLEQQWREFDCR